MTTNENLGPLGNRRNDYRHRVFFPNGYGASIASSPLNYVRQGEFEVAPLIGQSDDDCRIARDVLPKWFDDTGIRGYVDPMELSGLLRQIAALPPSRDDVKPAGPCNLASDDAFDESGRPV